MSKQCSSAQATTQFIEVDGRRLAYRQMGEGAPLVLCLRFRGTMDSWDPAFLDALACQGYQVTIFDYTGLGRSTGTPTYEPASLAKDAIDLISALGLGKVALGGWSIGGIVAQLVLAYASSLVSHLVLIGTVPPGNLVKTGEPLFYELAARDNGFDDFVTIFFEPTSATSRKAAQRSATRLAARTTDTCPPVPYEWAAQFMRKGPTNPVFPAEAVLNVLKTTEVPVLHLGGDHDIVFPVENWYALSAVLPTLQIVTMPQAGHGPNLQYPRAVAGHIVDFLDASQG